MAHSAAETRPAFPTANLAPGQVGSYQIDLISVLLMVGGLVCGLVLIWAPPAPSLFLGMTCLCLLVLGVIDTTAAICLLLMLNPLMFLVRNAAPDSIVFSGARSMWMFSVALGWGLALISSRARLPRGADTVAICVFLIYAILMAGASRSLMDGFLGLRAVAMPAAIYLVTKATVTQRPNTGYALLLASIASTTIFIILTWLWTAGLLETSEFAATTILGGGGRRILGVYFERNASLIGGGPSNAGIFVAAGLVMCLGLIFSRRVHSWWRGVLLVIAIAAGYTAFFTLSRSVVILLLVGLSCFMLTANIHRASKVVFLVAIGLLFVGTVIGTAFGGVDFISVTINYSVMWLRAIPRGVEAIIGSGLEAAGGTKLGIGAERSNFLVDGGWPAIWAMMGLPGIGSMAILLYLWVLHYYRLCRFRFLSVRNYTTGVIAGATAIGLFFGSPHTAIIMRPVSDMLFYALSAVAMSIYDVGYQMQQHPDRSANFRTQGRRS